MCSIVKITTDAGITGLGETYGGARTPNGLCKTTDALTGLDQFHLKDLRNHRVERCPTPAASTR